VGDESFVTVTIRVERPLANDDEESAATPTGRTQGSRAHSVIVVPV
jgi:hypothetical protein